MSYSNNLSSRWLSNRYWFIQIFGGIINSKRWALFLFCAIMLWILPVVLSILLTHFRQGSVFTDVATTLISYSNLIGIISSSSIFICICRIIRVLNPIFALRRQEERITFSQIALLSAFGIWIMLLIHFMRIDKNSNDYLIITLIGAVLGWAFQDTIKSVVAFFYLRANGLLKIGDWIEVKDRNIDGMVRLISLTTVTIENWDTTTSAFPIHILHSGHFMNKQRMMEGKTFGRRMLKTFIIDTGWIHKVTESEAKAIAEHLDMDDYFKEKVIKVGELNIALFRMYVYHWLKAHPHISHEPRLIVRWLEQTDEGMPLQVYAFITDSSLATFEWQQSAIMEHIIKSLGIFNLRLYQSPSGYDTSNNNVFMTSEKADYRTDSEN